MAVDGGAAVAGNMLDDRQHAAGQQPSHTARPSVATTVGLVAVGAVADDGVGAGHGNVEHRQRNRR